jgi:hypothetical protein
MTKRWTSAGISDKGFHSCKCVSAKIRQNYRDPGQHHHQLSDGNGDDEREGEGAHFSRVSVSKPFLRRISFLIWNGNSKNPFLLSTYCWNLI